jgi:hypothetical protein
MNYRILFIFLLLSSISCGSSKKQEEHKQYSYLRTDNSLFRGKTNRVISEQLLSHHIRLTPPDSCGRQAVLSLTETRLNRTGTDSVFIKQENQLTKKETIDHAVQQSRETTSPVSVPSFVRLAIGMALVYLLLRRDRHP